MNLIVELRLYICVYVKTCRVRSVGKITTVGTDCWFRRQRINLRVSKYTKGFRDDSLQLVLSEFYVLNLIKI